MWFESRFWEEMVERSRRSRIASVKGSSVLFLVESVGIEMNIGGRKFGESGREEEVRPRKSRSRFRADSCRLAPIASSFLGS